MKKKFTKIYYYAIVILLFVGASLSANAQDTKNDIVDNIGATAMCRDAAGNVYVIRLANAPFTDETQANDELVEYPIAGGSPVVLNSNVGPNQGTSGGFTSPTGLAIASNGDIYMTAYDDGISNGDVMKLTKASSYATKTTFYAAYSSNYGNFYGLAMDSHDNLYVTGYDVSGNGGNGTFDIFKFSSVSSAGGSYTGNPAIVNSHIGDAEQTGFAANNHAEYVPINAIVIDGSDNIFVAEPYAFLGTSGYDGGSLVKLSATGPGTYGSSAGSLVTLKSSFYGSALGFDPSGNLYAIVITNPTTSMLVYQLENLGLDGVNAASPTPVETGLGGGIEIEPWGIAAINGADIYVINGEVSGSGQQGDIYQLFGTPATPASGVGFSSTTANATTISWSNGNGSSRAVFMAALSSGTPGPVNGTGYTPNAAFGTSGTQIGSSGWYCVFNSSTNGNGTSVSVTGLNLSTTYRVMVVEYNGGTGTQNYNTTSATNNPNNITTATPAITASGSFSSMSTTTGAPSSPSSITVSGSNLTTGVTATVNTGFDVSLDNVSWSSAGGSKTITQSGGSITNQTVYVRLDASDGVGFYTSGNVALTTTSATTVNVPIPTSAVNSPSTTIQSLTASPTSTNGTSVIYTATFLASVSGLTIADFGLSTSGVSAASVITVVQVTGNTYEIVVHTGTGDGTIQLVMNSSSGVSPSVSNIPFSGTTVTVDKTAPTASIGSPSASYANSSASVSYTVTFSDAHLNNSSLTPANLSGHVTVTGTVTPNPTIAVTPLGGNQYTVTFSNVTGDGTLAFTVPAGLATDNAANTSTASSLSTAFTVDNMAPAVTIVGPSKSITSTGSVSYSVNYNDVNYNTNTLGLSNVTLNKTGNANGSLSFIGTETSSPTVIISNITGDGTLGISVASGSASDKAGNLAPAAGPSTSFTVDNTGPAISISAPSVSVTNDGPVSYTVTYSDANFNSSTLSSGNITLNGSGATAGSVVVSGSGTTRTVTLSGITGDGTLGITIAANTATDNAGNGAPASSASTTFTVDNTAPTVSISPPSVLYANSNTIVNYTVTFNDPNLDYSSIHISPIDILTHLVTTGTVSFSSITANNPVGNTVLIQLSATGDGTMAFSVPAGAASDLAGNTSPASSVSAAFTVDNTAPTVSSITATTPSNANPTNAASVTYTVNFSEAVTGVSNGSFTGNNLTGTVSYSGISVNQVSSSSYSVSINGLSGDGTIRLDFTNQNSGSIDPAGNPAIAYSSGDVYTIDNTPPGLMVTSYASNNANSAVAKVGDIVTLAFTTTETVQTPTVTIDGNAATVSNASGNNWTASYTETNSDTEGDQAYSVSFADLAGNTNTANGGGVTFDKTAPLANTLVFKSNHPGNQLIAVPGDVVSLLFTTSEAIQSPTVSIGGNGITAVNTSGNNWVVSYTVTAGDPLGRLHFSLTITDAAGNSTPYDDVDAGDDLEVVSTDALLSSLVLSNGTLSPGFNGNTTSYTNPVGYGLTSIKVTPTAENAGATITVNGNPVTSGVATSVPVTVGSNGVQVVVTAADGTTKQTYNVSVPEASSPINTLYSLKTSAGFAQGTTVPATMTESVVNSVNYLTVTATATDPNAFIKVNSMNVTSGQPSDIIQLAVGANTITVVVTAPNTATKTYTLTVTRAPSADDKLSNLAVSSGTLSPAFGTPTNYLDYVANNVQFSVTPTVDDPTATVTVNGASVTSGSPAPLLLGVGNNNITIVVKAQSGATKTYTLVVNEGRSPNSTLYSLTTNAGFSQGQTVPTTLTESVPNATSTITVTPTMADNTATVTVNGTSVISGSSSAAIALGVGGNTITIVGTAQNGNTTTYTLTVTRAASSLLTGLTATAGSLNPAFDPATTSYAIYAPNGTTSTSVTPTAPGGATIKVNGSTVSSGSASAAIATPVGNTIITVAVTAADNSTTTTYTVGVNVARAPNSTLYSLSTSAGFSQGQTVPTTLTESVPYSTSSLTVTPTMADNTATVTVNGATVASGSASSAINLSVGNNTITVVGTAQNGSTTTYTLTVTRAASANLSSLTLSAGTLSPAFASGTTAYSAAVGNGASSITLTPTATGAGAVIKVNGTTVTSGTASSAIPLMVGNTSITITVTAEDNSSTITYNVGVNRSRSSNDALLSYKTSAGLAKGVPVPTTLTESVVNATSTITITPTVQDATATVTVNNQAVTSGTASQVIALNVGSNTITTVVTAQSGVTQTYTLTVTRAMGSMNTVYQPIGVTKPTADVQLSDDGINVHQGLSPNGDGINDFLQIDNISSYPDNNLKIMNRNGQLVYETKGYDNATKAFDGHSNKTGQMQLPGTYFYSLDYTIDGVTKHKTGYLVLKY